MRRLLCLAVMTTPLLAQALRNPAVSAARANWEEAHDYILRSAQQMPESLYAYKPTTIVRSFGEILAHVAASDYFYCAAALGEQPRDEDQMVKANTTKSAITQLLKDAGSYCSRAYSQTDAQANGAASALRNRTRLYALVADVGHNMEHYGNLITYFRINGMVPPSSQPTR